MEKNFQDKIAVVTGGGQGLGREIVYGLAQKGATVILGEINKETGLKVSKEFQDEGLKVRYHHLNVMDEGSVQRFAGEIEKGHGRLDFLINNAGVDVTKPFAELKTEEWQRVIGVNLTGPFLTTSHLLPLLKKQGGHVVNVVSTAAKRAWENAAAYHASKWGLLGFSHSLFAELRKDNVKVSAVVAGGMRTPFILERFPGTDPEVLQDPKNVAQAIAYLLSFPAESIIPEIMVLPLKETSWP